MVAEMSGVCIPPYHLSKNVDQRARDPEFNDILRQKGPWKPNVAWQNMRIASSRTIQTSSTLLATALASAGQFEDSIFIAQGAAARSRTGSDRAMVDRIER